MAPLLPRAPERSWRCPRQLGVSRERGQHRKDPEAFARLIHDVETDVETKIFDVLPDETWVYPGHGDDTTLGAERPHLPEWHARGW